MNRFAGLVCLLVLTTFAACGDPGNGSEPNRPVAISPSTAETASDVIVYSARDIITMNPQQAHATAIAVSGDRILSVGSMDSVLTSLGNRQYVADSSFKDLVILPGLIDQHMHPLLAAISLSMEVIAIEDWVLPGGTAPAAQDRDDYLNRLVVAESELLDADEILFTWGFHHYFHGKLTRADLDAISASRPIVVWHRSAHEFILNTPALDYFEINEGFVSEFSEAAKAQSSLEEGHFWEQGWYPVLYKIMPTLTSGERLQSGLEFVVDYFRAAGVTLIAEPGGMVSRPLQDAQNSVLGENDTPFRSYFIVDGKTMANSQLDNLIPASESVLDWGEGKTSFLPKQAKLFSDGAIFSQAMQMLDGYEDGHDGEWMMDLDVFAAAFNQYWDADYQIHIHQNGDAGLEMVLDLLEAAQARNPRDDHRTVLVHFGFSTKEQVDRIAELGAIVSANPYYLTALADNYSENGLGSARADEMVRLGDVVRAGISLSFHSDMPMAPGRPLFLMGAAVNRITVSGRVAGPEQRISVEDALKAVTLDAAYSLQLEKEVGSLEEGKLANMTILEASPYEVDPETIKDIGIWGTMHEGVRYQGTAHATKPE